MPRISVRCFLWLLSISLVTAHPLSTSSSLSQNTNPSCLNPNLSEITPLQCYPAGPPSLPVSIEQCRGMNSAISKIVDLGRDPITWYPNHQYDYIYKNLDQKCTIGLRVGNPTIGVFSPWDVISTVEDILSHCHGSNYGSGGYKGVTTAKGELKEDWAVYVLGKYVGQELPPGISNSTDCAVAQASTIETS